MHGVDGVKVHTSLEAQQSGIALGVGINRVCWRVCTITISRSLRIIPHMVQKDIIFNAVGKEGQLCRYITRGKVKSQVGLQTVFRFEAFVADFIAQRPLMFTIEPSSLRLGARNPRARFIRRLKCSLMLQTAPTLPVKAPKLREKLSSCPFNIEKPGKAFRCL